MAESLEHVLIALRKAFGPGILAASHAGAELSVTVVPSEIREVLTYLRDQKELLFKQLTDLCGVDYLGREEGRQKRFDVVYHLLSYKFNLRVRLKVQLDLGEFIPSVSKIYSAATWYEREVWDMFGLQFDGHSDLRRLLTDYDFAGHPLRKDFPLTGYVEPRYDETQKRVVYNPVKLPQEFRTFDFLSPWEGMTRQAPHLLPGDEKARTVSAKKVG